MSDTVPPKGQRAGEADCTAPLATVGLARPLRPGTTLATRSVGRVWLNGRELGAADPRYTHLEASHD